MADDGKINCTKLPHEAFLIRAIYFDTAAYTDCSLFKEKSQSLTINLTNTQLDFIEMKQDSFSPSELNEFLKTYPAQVNLLLYNESNLKSLADFTHKYNNTFHNSPNILICSHTESEATALVKRYPSFDVCIYNNDYKVLADLLVAIRNRTYDDQPIDLSVFKNITYKQLIA
jgi:hypothetical protein